MEAYPLLGKDIYSIGQKLYSDSDQANYNPCSNVNITGVRDKHPPQIQLIQLSQYISLRCSLEPGVH